MGRQPWTESSGEVQGERRDAGAERGLGVQASGQTREGSRSGGSRIPCPWLCVSLSRDPEHVSALSSVGPHQ